MVNIVTEPQSRFMFMSHRASYIICLVTLVSVRIKSSLLFFCCIFSATTQSFRVSLLYFLYNCLYMLHSLS
jgi:hypothetical protein